VRKIKGRIGGKIIFYFYLGKDYNGKNRSKAQFDEQTVASAGGLEALQALFHGMPAQSGMAFVVVTHLDPTHMSMLPELMQKQTPIKVWQAESGLAVRPNNLYIIPPNREMEIREGVLSLSERLKKESRPIDLFFTSLAVDLKQRAVGVILSGMGTDGVRGLAEILKNGGRTLIQDPEDAKYDSMPRSAL
jgi:two-component system CheB/CheR fusion protein